ncbi:hypothetical protein NCER_100436 [Vairimorpha ceranae BRL01]|uniref:Uncharacterized protein n=2 Tax=Vairimorpha ceranae TaxID=40302 RepID=C4V7K3_VAIC1|nr:hypothetical protein AAJ76_800036239 [Vairimorpha ceranae]EEQ82801.1 hypothetical protein NCER_100436 [Vairimorpha ceranae BRL01]KAF5140707.1 hypothetical protein G9O61_00g012030 [Vairimorpha ceranae]KKO75989.1 hypothetical protein AAJ76_800036239 [Vairimorpha ceranae]
MLNLRKYLYGLILSTLFAYKYTYSQNTSTFCTDMFLVPLTCTLVFAIQLTKFSEENITGGFVAGLLYSVSYCKFIDGCNKFNIEFSLLINCAGLYIASLFKFLISDRKSLSASHLSMYLLFVLIISVFILKDKEFDGIKIVLSGHNNFFSIVSYVSYTVVANIFTNEMGIKNFLALSSYPQLVIFLVCACFFRINSIYTEPLVDNIIYYIVSLLTYIGTVAYVQMYGIITTNTLHLSNLLIYILLIYSKKLIKIF